MKKIIAILICLAIIMSSTVTVYADENNEKIYNTISVEFSDNIGKLEKLQVMVEENKVYANAEELGIRLGYNVTVHDKYIAIYNQDSSDNVPYGLSIFYYDSTKVGHMLFNQMVDSYEAPFATIRNEEGVWIPLEFSLLLLNSSMLIVDNVILIDMPRKTIMDVYMDICKDNQKYLFDWQEDIGISQENENDMQSASFVVTLFNGLLGMDGESWLQCVQSVALDSSAYDSKYGERLAMLFCTYSADELEKSVKTIKKQMSYFNGKGVLGKVINEIDKELDKNIGDLLATSKDLKSKIDINNKDSIAAYNKSYQALENACDKADFFSNATELYTKVGKEVSEATSFLDKFYKVSEVVGYASEFKNQDKFAVSALLEFVDSSNSQSAMSKSMKESISNHAGILQTNLVTYSALRYLEENYNDWIVDKFDLSSVIGLPANLMLIGWDVAKDKIPFYENGLDNTDSFMLSMYAGIFQADAFTSYQALRNSTFNDVKNITPENLYEVSQYCYTYLKSCYITRNAALGALTDNTKKAIPNLVEYQNNINKEIAGYLVLLKNADITNESGCYGFLPEDNEKYLKEYDDKKIVSLAKSPIEIYLEKYINDFSEFYFIIGGTKGEKEGKYENWIRGNEIQYGNYEGSSKVNEMEVKGETYGLYGIYVGQSRENVKKCLFDLASCITTTNGDDNTLKIEFDNNHLWVSLENDIVKSFYFWHEYEYNVVNKKVEDNDICGTWYSTDGKYVYRFTNNGSNWLYSYNEGIKEAQGEFTYVDIEKRQEYSGAITIQNDTTIVVSPHFNATSETVFLWEDGKLVSEKCVLEKVDYNITSRLIGIWDNEDINYEFKDDWQYEVRNNGKWSWGSYYVLSDTHILIGSKSSNYKVYEYDIEGIQLTLNGEIILIQEVGAGDVLLLSDKVIGTWCREPHTEVTFSRSGIYLYETVIRDSLGNITYSDTHYKGTYRITDVEQGEITAESGWMIDRYYYDAEADVIKDYDGYTYMRYGN